MAEIEDRRPRFDHRPNALEAQNEALKIAFGPIVFHCVRLAWKRGLLALLEDGNGLAPAEIATKSGLSEYAVVVLMESCLSAGVVDYDGERYSLSKTGHFVLNDRMTQVNFDFVHDVCYHGIADLEQSLEQGRPIGLQRLGPWSTLYEGMTRLPEPARSSWFAFDHYYSDAAFDQILETVFARKPRRLLDVGANTGKWALHCLAHSEDVELTLVDLPAQLAAARSAVAMAGGESRVRFAPMDVLQENQAFPGGQDAVWMSQFLTCFSEERVVSLFRRAREALAADGRVFVLDTLWDRQKYEISAYCLINTSPYFTTMASGNSRMYRATDYVRAAASAGLELEAVTDDLGVCHSLLTFRPTSAACREPT
jgi:ubiquinone/menaquinone biosynthesis C-methylase UbiE